MLQGDPALRYKALNHLYDSSLTSIEQEILAKKIEELSKDSTKESPHYSTLLFLSGIIYAKGMHFNVDRKKAIQLFKQAIVLNNSCAMHALAILSTTKIEDAISLLDLATGLKNPLAMCQRADFHRAGVGGPIDFDAAIKLYDQAIALNDTQAMLLKADCFEKGTCGLSTDLKAAIELLDKAIELDDATAMSNRAVIHANNGEVESALKLYDRAIGLGSDTALNNKAFIYRENKDYSSAIYLYDKAIALEFPRAMLSRARMHVHGLGGPVNYAAAIELYEQAIKLDEHKDALSDRALMHMNGYGGPVDYEKAIDLYEKLLKLDPDTLLIPPIIQAIMHHKKGNYKDAIALYDQLIAEHNPEAMNRRAHMHMNDMGGPKDYQAAIRLYDQAISQENSDAMLFRGLMHAEGYGGPVNLKKAIALYDQAIGFCNMKAVAQRAYLFSKNIKTPVDEVKHRVLKLVIGIDRADQRLPQEDFGFYRSLRDNHHQYLKDTSITYLALALNYLNTLPKDLGRVSLLKTYIFNAIGKYVIPKFPALEGFHESVATIDNPHRMNSVLFLIKHYSNEHYTEKERMKVDHALSFETFAKKPEGRHILKVLAKVFSEAHYWLAISYLGSKKSRGLFAKSAEKKAIEHLTKAADPRNQDEKTRQLAVAKLREMGIATGQEEEKSSIKKVSDNSHRLFTPKPSPVVIAPNKSPIGKPINDEIEEQEHQITYPVVPLEDIEDSYSTTDNRNDEKVPMLS